MSEKLIVEFYRAEQNSPIAVILVRHCGEDPASAALTVAGFVASVKDGKKSDWLDAGDLVSRFVLWEADISGTSISSPYLGTSFLSHASTYPYQLVRLRVIDGAVNVEIVIDEYSTEAELEEATMILAAVQLPTAFVPATEGQGRMLIQAGLPLEKQEQRQPQQPIQGPLDWPPQRASALAGDPGTLGVTAHAWR